MTESPGQYAREIALIGKLDVMILQHAKSGQSTNVKKKMLISVAGKMYQDRSGTRYVDEDENLNE